MNRPTHVMVASPMQCDLCKGTGKRPTGHLSFEHVINERGEEICPSCAGAKLQQHWVTLEDFAKLFVQTETRFKDSDGNWGARAEIVVRETPPSSNTDTRKR